MFSREGVMVWGEMMIDGRVPLHFFNNRSVTDQKHRNEVLEPYVILFKGAYGSDLFI